MERSEQGTRGDQSHSQCWAWPEDQGHLGPEERDRPVLSPQTQPQPRNGLSLSLLPPELLLAVLSRLPPRVLLKRCRHVCRTWRSLVDSKALWLLMLARDHSASGRALLALVRSCLPPAGDATPGPLIPFCSLRPVGRNLIRNPCGQEGLQKWSFQHSGDGWVVENNLIPVPGAPSQTCFVTSYRWCSKKQILNLEAEGLWPELLDSGKIDICVSDWWGTRHECGGRYKLLVQLLDANKTILHEFSDMRVTIAHPNSMYFQVTHVFSNIKVGVRFVSFEHAGKDTLFWAGYYGTRMTNSSVTVRVSQP
ncbi:F-box only protein 27-like isoform X1 [Octodon degus]|uniref:F-box only protein 27-like isoform X1 n=1 Tax=Octodon degus TaxID=10160 RepID=A0A6P6EZA9_OCTDE|nr:F-box only protein 27-like isoform X1 [Octodon degus]